MYDKGQNRIESCIWRMHLSIMSPTRVRNCYCVGHRSADTQDHCLTGDGQRFCVRNADLSRWAWIKCRQYDNHNQRVQEVQQTWEITGRKRVAGFWHPRSVLFQDDARRRAKFNQSIGNLVRSHQNTIHLAQIFWPIDLILIYRIPDNLQTLADGFGSYKNGNLSDFDHVLNLQASQSGILVCMQQALISCPHLFMPMFKYL